MSHSLIVDVDYNVYGFGFNKFGQLGSSDYINKNKPTKIEVEIDGLGSHTMTRNLICQTSCGRYHSLILDHEGNVYSFGLNDSGELGLGDKIKRNKPTKIKGLPDIKGISCGFGYSLVLDYEGNVYSFGWNNYGQLGLGDNDNRNIPVKIEGILPIESLSCSHNHSLILDIEGNVYSFGGNKDGQLGLGDNIDKNIPVKIKGLNTFIENVSCGMYYSLILDVYGNIYSFGNNTLGRLGLGDNIDRNTPVKIEVWNEIPKPFIKSVSCGYNHSLSLDIEGAVYSFGCNGEGQLGLNGDKNKPTKIETLPYIKYILCSGHRSLFLDHGGNVYSLGHNYSGQLGLGDNISRYKPTKITGLPIIQHLGTPIRNTKYPKNARNYEV